MIAGLISLLGSSAFGTILGGLFAWLNRKADIESKRVELEHETKKWAHDLLVKDKDLEYAKVEAAGRKEVAIIEGDSAIESARMQAISVAQAADRISAEEIKAAGKWKWLLVVGHFANRFVRPALTAALAGTAIYVNMALIAFFTQGWDRMTTIQQYESGMQAFAWITGQAAAVISYWFVSRGSSK